MSTPTKVCPSCKQELPLNPEFWYESKTRKNGYRTYCKKCSNEKNNHWWQKNPEKNKEKSKRWYQKNPEKVVETRRRHYQANSEKIMEYIKRWRKENPENRKAEHSRRRARKKNAEGSHTGEQIKALFEQQEGRCFHCGCDISQGYHIDHWIPLSKGGSNWPENLRLLCEHCNCSKHDKMPWEWDSKYPKCQ